MTSSFPKRSIDVVRGVDHEYEVHWIEEDLAYLTLHGDLAAEFCSIESGGFVDEEDVINQASDIVADWDAGGL